MRSHLQTKGAGVRRDVQRHPSDQDVVVRVALTGTNRSAGPAISIY